MRHFRRWCVGAVAAGLAVWMAWCGPAPSVGAEEPAPPRVEFTRLVAHWAEYREPGYLDFIAEAQPDIAQLGFYGAHFWSLAHTPHGQGYPAHFPLVGLKENSDWFRDMNAQVHQRGTKVVGHFNVKFLVGDPTSDEGPRGFFKFYRDLWDEKLLGPRPVDDPLQLLEVDATGQPRSNNSYSIGGMKEYWACLLNPHWQAVLKAWAKRGIEQGVDGYVANYFYRHDCHCRWCQQGFRDYLSQRFKPEELKARFGIEDLATHRFAEIVGWHDPAESTLLRREMLRFSQIANKNAFDEVFVKYGRSLKRDLILAQWNHLGDFNQIDGDERCLLPTKHWGRDEDYLWYSSGGAAFFTDLPEGMLGELSLQCRYIRGAFDDKPYTMGKYENTRIRAAISELAANGGAPMGFYTRFTDPVAREHIVRYYQFLKRYDALYRANRPHAEAVLYFPRTQVHRGEVAAVEEFKRHGYRLLNEHVLFDIRPDDVPAPADAGPYAQHVLPPAESAAAPATPIALSRFQAPSTVRVSASRPAAGGSLTVHLVNYNRTEPAEKRSAGGGAVDEKPIAAPAVPCEVNVPAGRRLKAIVTMTPEEPDGAPVPFQMQENRAVFELPGFLVYRIANLEYAE